MMVGTPAYVYDLKTMKVIHSSSSSSHVFYLLGQHIT